MVADKGLRTQEPPKVEWWDEKLVNGSYEIFNIAAYNPIVEELVTHLVQHPIPIMPPTHNEKIAARPVMLTKKVWNVNVGAKEDEETESP